MEEGEGGREGGRRSGPTRWLLLFETGKKGYEVIGRYISTVLNGRVYLIKSESYLIELCILGLEGRRWGVHIRPIWHDDPLEKSMFKTKLSQTGFRTCSRSKLGSCSMALMLAGRPLVAAGAC